MALTAPSAEAPPRGHVQLPRSLLYSECHSGLAVWVWAEYETLMPHRLGGGRAPTFAGRRWLAERVGASATALDDARRELLAPVAGGAYLSRSAPRGRMRSVLHTVLRLPKQTGEPFAPVPAWSLTRVWAGRRRPAGRVSADAWRLYAACVDRVSRPDALAGLETTVARLGELLRASAATGRRRLTELEAAGLVEVGERAGGWLVVRPILDALKATAVARSYAEHGRRRVEPRPDPYQIAVLAPARKRQSPLADSGTPFESPTQKTAVDESPSLPAAGETTRRTERTEPAKPGKSSRNTVPKQRVGREAAELYRVLPAGLRSRIPEHGSRRVLNAIAVELQHRSPDELADRIARNQQYWLIEVEPVRDAVAVAIRWVRRGLDCPDVRCEDGHQLDLDSPCKACALAAAERATAHAPAVDPPLVDEPAEPRPDRRAGLRRAPARWSRDDGTSRAEESVAAAAQGVDARPYAALARTLLNVRDGAKREELLATHQTRARSA